jgi:hypothetical protein
MPATLEPPPTRSRVRGDFVPRPPQSGKNHRWSDRFVRSAYFFGAVLIHLVIFALIATWVVIRVPAPPAQDTPFIAIPSGKKEPPPPPPPVVPHDEPQLPSSSSPSSSPLNYIRTGDKNPFTMPIPVPGMSNLSEPHPATHFDPRQFLTNGPSAARIQKIRDMEQQKWGRTLDNIINSDHSPANAKAKFTVYLASYADGDWACNNVLDGQGHVVAGALPNLLAKVREWSHDNIQATVELQPLAISSPDLLSKMPPFIFFTGHKDFRLTPAEVKNLQKYVADGGLIWGDNALPGYGSRFDVAFRREMKRVIPDKDKPFQDVTMDHDLFTRDKWFDFDQLPTGMNYFHEPMQHIDLDGIMAILYTPNDYSDMAYLRILPGDQAYEGGWHRGLTLWSSEEFLNNNKLFFRNFDLPACYQSQRLGADIIGYLIIRWDDVMLLNL